MHQTEQAGYLHGVNIGKAKLLNMGSRRILSGIGKSSVAGSHNITRLGIEGDEQVELSIHGGVDKAIYAYPIEHYQYWQQNRKSNGVSLFEEELPLGFMGENLTISGLLENDVFIGDELHFPDCVLRVTAPREPCAKFNTVMGHNHASKDMALSGCSGFYLAVDQVGTISPDQNFTLQPGRRGLSVAQAFAVKWAKHSR